ncbi:hypothetical protein V5P93_003339 [Actinokineospora auranticolor]|uniref:PknH-like protein n=1 Tax=Actinokineospora auranticolor TaxID=155976 RepID=A0A2S6H1Y5_9PSEU|nr:hypothetical protein [Actinokineospora auranticolor]PPK71473.1 hypothetical protein CLV40_101663 [Actinokineospora auranticolor]
MRIRGIALVPLVLVVAGCGAVDEPPLGAIGTITRESQISRPIDQYLPSEDDLARLWQVRGAATATCYARHGVPDRTSVPPRLRERLREQRKHDLTRSPLYGFFDTGDAHDNGYGTSPDSGHGLETPAPWAPPEVVKECEAAGSAAVGNLHLVTDERVLPDGGPPPATADRRVAEAVDAWAGCMRAAGHPYGNPIDPLLDPKWRRPISTGDGTRQPTTAAEIDTATADVRCKIEVNLVGTAVAVQAAYDQRYIDSHATQLTEFAQRVHGYTRGQAN